MSNGARLFWLVFVATLFGPYLIGGIRTEQAFIYAAAAMLGVSLTILRLRRITLPGPLLLVGVAWLVLAAVAVAGSLGPPPASRWPPASPMAGLDNLLPPVAVTLVAVTLVTPTRAEVTLRWVCGALAMLAAANGALSIAQTRVDLAPVLRVFWGSDSIAVTTSELAATMGRFSGIFNQPAEAGLMYGLAGLCAVHVWASRPRVLYPLLALIFAGGVLCVSKVFLLVGAPLVLWRVWRIGKQKVAAVFVVVVAALGLRQFGFFAQWAGLEYALRLLNPPDDSGVGGLMSFYTAGRVGGEQGTLEPVVDEVMSVAPWFGFGARGLQVPYDNGWVEALIVAGMFGAVVFTVTLLLWARVAWSLRGRTRGFALAVVLLAVGASFGLPALTANRAGPALWLVMVLLGLVLAAQQAGPSVVKAEAMGAPQAFSAPARLSLAETE